MTATAVPKMAILQFSSSLVAGARHALGPTRGIPRQLANLMQNTGRIGCEIRDLQRDSGRGTEAVQLEEALSDEDALRLTVASTNGAQWALHGVIAGTLDSFELEATLLDVAGRSRALERTYQGTGADLAGYLVDLASAVLARIVPDGPPLDQLAAQKLLTTTGESMLCYLSSLASSDFDERIKLLADAFDRDPSFVEAGIELAKSHLVLRQFTEAEERLVAATRRDRISHAKLCETAIEFFTRGMQQEAVYLARKAMMWDPQNAQSYVPYIRIALMTGNIGDGLKYTQRAESLDPTHAPFQAFLSLFYRYMQDYEAAIRHAQRAIEMDPNDAFNYYALGSAHLYSRGIRPAIRHFEKALELNPQDVITHRELALAHCEISTGATARARIDRSLEMLPGDAFLLTLKARTWLDEDPDQAQFCLERAIQHQPHFAEAHGWLGQVLREKQEHVRSLHHLEKALELDPQNPRWHRERGKLLLATDKPDEAQLAFQHALDLEE